MKKWGQPPFSLSNMSKLDYRKELTLDLIVCVRLSRTFGKSKLSKFSLLSSAFLLLSTMQSQLSFIPPFEISSDSPILLNSFS